jgi:hypothetical protein
MFKRLCILSVILIQALLGTCQSDRLEVFSSVGQSGGIGFTIGETFTSTMQGDDSSFAQGFQQPDQIATDVQEIEPAFELALFPNPSRDFVTIISDVDLCVFDALVFDAQGRKVKQTDMHWNEPTDVSFLARGYYIVHLQSKEGELLAKIPFIRL